ncbi:MAG TPA: hypothetical protein VK696_05275 [Steroidobacteraceae bacterium]|nr:hypothetical protein [Steroidobacteraceae bacterium]
MTMTPCPPPPQRNQLLLAAAFTFAFAASQSVLDISTNPCPLQEFMPLQEFLADLQEDWPLQELTPVHFILASSALAVETARVPNRSAAAVAIATPPAFVVFMLLAPLGLSDYRAAGPAQGAEMARLGAKTGVAADLLQENTCHHIRL